jgi:hypothetical protein
VAIGIEWFCKGVGWFGLLLVGHGNAFGWLLGQEGNLIFGWAWVSKKHSVVQLGSARDRGY